jgi:hypothetical protein
MISTVINSSTLGIHIRVSWLCNTFRLGSFTTKPRLIAFSSLNNLKAVFILNYTFCLEDVSNRYIRNVDNHLQDYTML